MNSVELSAEIFGSTSIFFEGELMGILSECVNIYRHILCEKLLLSNNEEAIRDVFMVYLKNDTYKEEHAPLNNYQFDKEIEDNKGRLDIRILPVNPYRGDKAYYSIECKRIDNKKVLGKTGLNAEYIKNGVCRYVYEYYTSYYNANVMFGFVVVPMDISRNVRNINSLLVYDFINQQGDSVNAHVKRNITYNDYVNSYPYSYVSEHTCESGKELTLYHLMFDFSQNIK